MRKRRPIGRDAVTWIALGLVVAAILIVTTRHADPQAPTASAPSTQRQRLTTTPSPTPASTPASTPTSTTPTPSLTPLVQTAKAVPTTTTTTLPKQIKEISTGGQLSYPDDIATTYPFTVAAGLVATRVSWRSSTNVTAALRCGAVALRQRSSFGLIAFETHVRSGSCQLSVATSTPLASPLDYQVTLSYLPTNSSSS